jgi:hypothetical protein
MQTVATTLLTHRKTLLKVMIEPGTPASVKAIEIEDIEARPSELERAAEASKQMKRG